MGSRGRAHTGPDGPSTKEELKLAQDAYQRFAGKVGIVTGAGMGMGAAVARGLAAEGAAVGVLDRNPEAAERVAAEIIGSGGEALAVVGSVARSDDTRRAVSSTVERFGGLDLLVNNAGLMMYGEVPEFSEEDWDTIMGVNLKGQFLMAKYAIPEMKKRGGGAIVNFASVQALVNQRQVAAYAASKGGVVALTRALALDHAKDNIRVNSVLPGSVHTPMLVSAAQLLPGDPEQTIAEWGRQHPRGTVIEPGEVAAVALFLLSSDASAVTGAAYVADGGLSVQVAL
jgi:NAD(P)-dependent dehydrogenase (short-subunit alcohol dehydrogenase family)